MIHSRSDDIMLIVEEGEKMKSLTGKLLLVGAGAAVGAIGYMAWKHPETLRALASDARERAAALIETNIRNMAAEKPGAET